MEKPQLMSPGHRQLVIPAVDVTAGDQAPTKNILPVTLLKNRELDPSTDPGSLINERNSFFS
jgi:hypothetical protein